MNKPQTIEEILVKLDRGEYLDQNGVDTALQAIKEHIAWVIGEDFTVATNYDDAINGLLAMQRKRAGL